MNNNYAAWQTPQRHPGRPALQDQRAVRLLSCVRIAGLRARLSAESIRRICPPPLARGSVVGGLAANELRKFEQERSEVYFYDLAWPGLFIEADALRGVLAPWVVRSG